MELRDLYDENKELTGETIYKGQDVPKGRYYITVVVFIQNSKNEFLIQKRVKKKDGKWATTGGHPVSGETSKQGIITEIKEELGVDIVKENIKLFKTIKTEDDFVDIYYLKEDIDIKKIKIQKEEVEDVKWATIEEINELPFEFNMNSEIDIGDLLKIFNIKIDTSCYTTIIEKVEFIISIISTLKIAEILVIPNFKTYLTEEEVLEIYKYSIYNNVKLLILENKSNEKMLKYEQKNIIDENFDEI